MVAVSNRTATLFAIAHVIFASLLGAAGLLTVLTDCGLILLNMGAVLASGAWILALSRDSELHGGEGDHAHEGATILFLSLFLINGTAALVSLTRWCRGQVSNDDDDDDDEPDLKLIPAGKSGDSRDAAASSRRRKKGSARGVHVPTSADDK